MNAKSKRILFLAISAIGLWALYIIIMVVLGQPLFVLLLAYIAVIAVFYFLNRSSIWAVRGNYFYAVGQKARARTVLGRAVRAGTKSPTAYIYLALMTVEEDGDTKRAFELLERAREFSSSPQDARNAQTTLATCHWLAGDYARAIEIMEETRNTPEYLTGGLLSTLGYMYFLNGDYDKAAEVSREAIETDPGQGAAWDNLGQISYKLGDMDAAKENFQTALSKRENLADANFYLGLIYEAEGDADNAKEYFRRAAICTITVYNSITEEQANEKYKQYHS